MQSGTTTLSQDDALIPEKELLFDGSSSPEDFVRLGEGFVHGILIQRAFLTSGAAFLDIGCGNGGVARPLTGYLGTQGRYEGLDINESAVRWLTERYKAYPNFRFTHADVYNRAYNPGGSSQASEYRLPFEESIFDMALLKSVFTHMLPPAVDRYVEEIARVLKPGGRAVVTYFLLNDESRQFIARGQDTLGLRYEHEGDPFCRVANPEIPEAVVAHDESRIRKRCFDAGLSVQEVTYGNWCGRPSLLGLQDVVIVTRL